MTRIIGIIPARGGSKGLPGKNVRSLNGRPMIAYTLEAAANSCLTKILVTSDSDEILSSVNKEVQQYEAGVASKFLLRKRPDEYATDKSPLMDAIVDALQWAGLQDDLDAIMILQPTSPVRDPGDIDRVIAEWKASGRPGAVAVSEPLQQAGDMVVRSEGNLQFLIPRSDGPQQRQDYAQSWFITGSHYLVASEFFGLNRRLFDSEFIAVQVSQECSIDVDDQFGFDLAEAVIRNRQRRAHEAPMIESASALFFDFDGVLVDSVPLKTEAYCDIFEPFGPEAVRMIREYHQANGGVDRYRKIEHVLRKLEKFSSKTLEELADAFAQRVAHRVATAQPISAGMDLLKRACDLDIDCHIVSGTPEPELKQIVEQRDMGSMFISVNGSPRPKTQILSELISTHGYSPERCIMVGDASTDFHAAQSAGIWFIGFPVQAGSYSSLW